MAKRRIGNVVVRTGTYTDRSGNEKGSYITLGSCLCDESKVEMARDCLPLSIRLNAVPLPNEKGEVWITVYPLKDEKEEAPY